MKFILNPCNITDNSILKALSLFKRTVRIRKQFCQAQQSNQKEDTDLRVPNPVFQPNLASGPIEAYLNEVETRIRTSIRNNPYKHQSIPKAVTQGIQSLLSDNNIVIKPADKNLGTCVVSSTWYHTQALSQLSDTTTYELLSSPPNKENCYQALETILDQHNKLTYIDKPTIRTKDAQYLLQLKDNPMKLGKFYMTIKVHKEPPTGRPICSSIGTITYHCSKYLDKRFQPIMRLGKSYIKDSFGILNILRNTQFPHTCTLVTADVESLYPSIVTEDGLSALNQALIELQYSEDIRNYYVKLTQWVLNNNYIEFDDKMYRQIKGTAMGTPLAVTYANIYLSVLETQVLRRCIRNSPTFRPPILYKRFIDDILSIFEHPADGTLFIKEFNKIRPGVIRLTHQISDNSGVFLDVNIFKAETFSDTLLLDTKLFQKPMNKYVYLHYHSCHSKQLLKSYIQGEINRYRLTCSRNEDYETAKAALHSRLLDRGYPLQILDQWMDIHPNRNVLFEKRIKRINNKRNSINNYQPLIFKIPYTNRTSQLNLSKCLTLTEDVISDIDSKIIFNNRSPTICLTRPKNLSDILVRASYKHKKSSPT